MIGRRYPEGTAKVPELHYSNPPETAVEKLRSIKRNTYLVPKDAETSDTSEAIDCFVGRHFSKKMQQFMLHYSYSIVSSHVLSGEV